MNHDNTSTERKSDKLKALQVDPDFSLSVEHDMNESERENRAPARKLPSRDPFNFFWLNI